MSQWSDSVPSADESDQLSALVDGELEASEVQRACARWCDDAEMRSQWHAYHLIGDVLRSDELATPAGQDSAFLIALRGRFAQEPVVLAPAAPAVRTRSARRTRVWIGSAAVAAGFAAVIGVVVVTQIPAPGAAGVMALGASPTGPSLAASGDGLRAVSSQGATASEPPAVVLNGRLIRDARLDEYLAAHKKFGGSSAPGVPSGFLRNAAADGTGR